MVHVFITGANRGIGLAFVKHYLKQGAKVHACCRNPQTAHELRQLQSDQLQIHQLDVTDYDEMERLAAAISTPIDILISNAGFYGSKGAVLSEIDVTEWRKLFEVNTIAPTKLITTFLPHLNKGKQKKVICLSSKMGSISDNSSGGGYHYRSSKAALNAVVKSLSIDLQHKGIIVTALHPGWVKTEMGGPNALISAEESVKGMTQAIDDLTEDHSGGFYDYQGKEILW